MKADKMIVVMSNGKPVVSSRQIAEFLGIEHRNVMRTVKNLKCSEDFKANNFILSVYEDSKGRNQPEYLFTNKAVPVLMSAINNPKATAVMEMCGTAFDTMQKELQDRNTNGQLQLVDLNDKIAVAKKFSELYLDVAHAEEKCQTLETKVAEYEPKVKFADAISASDTDIYVGDLAKLLKQNGIDMGRTRMFAWLREHGWVTKVNYDRNTPTQKGMNAGLFRIKETVTIDERGRRIIRKTTMVTAAGQKYFLDQFLKLSEARQLTLIGSGTDATVIDADDNYSISVIGDEKTSKQLMMEENIALVKKFIDMPLPKNWNDYDIDKRREYTAKHINDMNAVGIMRTIISNAEIWCECFGGGFKDIKAKSHMISKIMKAIGGWTKEGQKPKTVKFYGLQKSYVLVK